MPQTKNLLTLTLRAYLGVTKLTLTAAAKAAKLAADAAGLGGRPAPSPRASSGSSGARSRATPAPSPVRPRTTAPVPDPATTPLTPLRDTDAAAKTIDDTDEVVAEFADPGGEDGAGATLAVDPPWDGYAQQTAATIVERLGGLEAAEVAVLELYERGHKNRQTVLNAARRRLKSLNPPA